jgi:NAD(P)-dependent dehydrogenase (short-subunit alcohol dehydrogenase family)
MIWPSASTEAGMGKTVLITGTSTGIGRACVEHMAGDGWTVYAGVRKKAHGDDLVASITGDVRPVMLDVTNPKHLAAVVKRLGTELDGRGLDGLVNNAGVAFGGPVETLSDEDWQQHFDINVFGLVRVTRELLPFILQAKGRIVNIASVSGRVGIAMFATYSAGKHAVEAISQSLRFELADLGVKVACVEPGEVQSAIWAKGDEVLAEVEASVPAEVIDRYQRHFDMMAGFLADGPKHGVPASRVSKAVHHALTASWPKHRYLVGPDAKLTGIGDHLPDRLKAPVLSLYAKRWERSGRKMRTSRSA